MPEKTLEKNLEKNVGQCLLAVARGRPVAYLLAMTAPQPAAEFDAFSGLGA